MKRTLWLAAMMAVAIGRPAWAQQDELARLKVELANQQAIIAAPDQAGRGAREKAGSGCDPRGTRG